MHTQMCIKCEHWWQDSNKDNGTFIFSKPLYLTALTFQTHHTPFNISHGLSYLPWPCSPDSFHAKCLSLVLSSVVSMAWSFPVNPANFSNSINNYIIHYLCQDWLGCLLLSARPCYISHGVHHSHGHGFNLPS